MSDSVQTENETDESTDSEGPEESRGTVILAGSANLAIAVAKVIGGVLTGSTAMLAEAAHSIADTLNEVFLFTALQRSRKPADELHPFGYGPERYFWSLLAAVGILVLGAGFSVLQGVEAILSPEKLTDLLLAYLILVISFLFEGSSWLKAVRQLRGEAVAADISFWTRVRTTPDPTSKTVFYEDSAAMIGLVLAAIGITLHDLTGQGFWDGAASVAIGILLVGVAYVLGRENKALLIGQAVPDALRDAIGEEILASPGVSSVVEVLTLRLGPDEVLVAARVDLKDEGTAGEVEHDADVIEERVRSRYPEVRHLFIDPTDDPDLPD